MSEVQFVTTDWWFVPIAVGVLIIYFRNIRFYDERDYASPIGEIFSGIFNVFIVFGGIWCVSAAWMIFLIVTRLLWQ